MKESLPLFACKPEYRFSQLVLISVPWAVTASFRGGAEKGPEMISSASSQMDFFCHEEKDIRSRGIFFCSPPIFLKKLHVETRKKALPVLALEESAPKALSDKTVLHSINSSCRQMVDWVYQETQKHHLAGKKVALVGGDHSVSEGIITYFSDLYKEDFGILHIDAHADLRKNYQGFLHSHASVMFNILHTKFSPSTLVQVGVRDYCEQEYLLIQKDKRIHTFFDSQIKSALFEGQTWKALVESCIQKLPSKIYISLDVDGLDPSLFPETGTPVPGGLSFDQVDYLLRLLSLSGREIIGFDLVEIASQSERKDFILWDAQVGARLLYRLCQSILLQK